MSFLTSIRKTSSSSTVQPRPLVNSARLIPESEPDMLWYVHRPRSKERKTVSNYDGP